jgi:hypothetical protein
MPREALRIETPFSRDAIDLIDALRAHGFRAGLAGTPGTWDVAVTGSLSEIAPVLAERLAGQGTSAAAVYAGERLFVVEAAPEPVRQRVFAAV